MLPGAPVSSLAWSSPASRRAKRRRRLSSCAGAGLSPDSRLRAPWLVVRKAPSVSLAPRLIILLSVWCCGRRRPSTTVPTRRWLLLGHMLLRPVGSSRVRGQPVPRDSVACFARSWPSWSRRGAPLESVASSGPDAQPPCRLLVEVHRISLNLMPRAFASGVLLLLLRTMASVFCVSKATAFASAHS